VENKPVSLHQSTTNVCYAMIANQRLACGQSCKEVIWKLSRLHLRLRGEKVPERDLTASEPGQNIRQGAVIASSGVEYQEKRSKDDKPQQSRNQQRIFARLRDHVQKTLLCGYLRNSSSSAGNSSSGNVCIVESESAVEQ